MAKKFGGGWTERKLGIVENYLKAYLTALKHQPFRLGYIDAFAGDGSIRLAVSEDDNTEEVGRLIEGSALRALALEFDWYTFVEKDADAAARLDKITYANSAVEVMVGDANERLAEICGRYPWRDRRAVAFLDPAGMQLKWDTLKRLAETEAMDVWIWFPLGVGASRMLTRSGEIPESWENRLDAIFGTHAWKDRFYDKQTELTLFGEIEQTRRTASLAGIAEFYNERLMTIFPSVAPNPALMKNSKNVPIYMLCFAAANPRGGKIAVNIASHLLDVA